MKKDTIVDIIAVLAGILFYAGIALCISDIIHAIGG